MSPHSSSTVEFLVPLTGFLLLGLAWPVIIMLVGRLGGWNRISESYPALTPPEGTLLRWRNLRINTFCRYRSSINFFVGRRGLYLKPMFLFKFGHPPIFLPWNEVTLAEKRAYFMIPVLVIEMKKLPGYRLQVFGQLKDQIQEAKLRSQSSGSGI